MLEEKYKLYRFWIEKEVVEDMMAVIHCFSCRLYSLRKYAKVLKDAVKK